MWPNSRDSTTLPARPPIRSMPSLRRPTIRAGLRRRAEAARAGANFDADGRADRGHRRTERSLREYLGEQLRFLRTTRATGIIGAHLIGLLSRLAG